MLKERRLDNLEVVLLGVGPVLLGLLVPEDDDTGGHHSVGEQRPDGHEVNQHIQIKDGSDQGCRDTEIEFSWSFKFKHSPNRNPENKVATHGVLYFG